MNILAIGSHPDDIEYGCGATLLKYAEKGHDVFLYVATDGSFGGDAETRRQEQTASAELMHAKDVFWGGYQDTEIPLNQKLIANVESVIKKTDPNFIFVHYRDDTHQDHRTLASATITATRYIPNFLFYEVPTTQGFAPTIFVDIGEHVERKAALLGAHESQVTRTNIAGMTVVDLARSCANFRGIQSRTGFAEAFSSLRLFINI